jgi:hypothetical protein
MTERYASETEVHQAEAESFEPTDIPVRIEGPADVRLLPAVAWVVTRFTVSDTTGPIRALGRNPYRKRVTLSCNSAGIGFFFGSSQEQVRSRETAGAWLTIQGQLELTHTEEIWINNTATETPSVTVIEEMWTN